MAEMQKETVCVEELPLSKFVETFVPPFIGDAVLYLKLKKPGAKSLLSTGTLGSGNCHAARDRSQIPIRLAICNPASLIVFRVRRAYKGSL